MSDYDPSAIDAKWQKKWEEAGTYEIDLDKAKKPYYTHVMWPYPSGDKLHVGHWYNFGPADSFARFMKMQGNDVFTPMGFDAFGLPAENYAVKTGIHPTESITENVKTMIKQLKRMGCMYDWSKSNNSSDPEYYKWTQWLFLQMFKNDLAYQKDASVNFCPGCKTVLANEQVWDGKCERCDSEVMQKPLVQWYLKITNYADRLLDNLDVLDWPEKTKLMQKNWIGRSEGIEILFEIKDTKRGVCGMNSDRGLKPAAEGGGESDDPTLKGGVTGSDTNVCGTCGNRALQQTNGIGTYYCGECGNRALQRADDSSLSPSPSGLQPARRTVHLTIEPYRREPIFQKPSTASFILRTIEQSAKQHDILIHEACAMPDHCHLIISFDKSRDLTKDIMQKIKGSSARTFNKQFQRQGALWARGGHHENIDSFDQFNTTINYVQQNPTKDNVDPTGRILSELPLTFTAFTTRADTLFGATFAVMSPEHPLVSAITTNEKHQEINKYRQDAAKKTELNRTDLSKEKTGIFTGAHAINPANGEEIQIWIADYVIMSYGSGAIMAVPGHDERDYDFACRHSLPIRCVIEPDKKITNFSFYVHPRFGAAGDDLDDAMAIRDDNDHESILEGGKCWTGPGKVINSEFINGLRAEEAKKEMTKWLIQNGMGKQVTTYRIRDWSISRQRYWGAPIPIVYDPEGEPHAVPEEYLPWTLPTDVEFKPTGTAPLAQSKELVKRTEKIFGKGWTPEVDTMDTFVCSSYYSYMYLAAANKKGKLTQKDLKDGSPVDPDIEKKWMPVDCYIGGSEHACMHLIYARFVSMALKDFGFVEHEEPYQRLVHQGVITNQGAKMSKSKGNVVSPDSFVEKYGSDVFRMYLMFMGPFTEGGDWNDGGIKGISRFAKRIHSFFSGSGQWQVASGQDNSSLTSVLHKTVKKVTEDIENMHFNTAISALMVLLNEFEKAGSVSQEAAVTFVKLLAPLSPHLAEELWEKLEQKGFVIDSTWSTYDPSLLISDTFTLVVQVNGKVRANIEVPTDISEEDALAQAKESENVKKFVGKKDILKQIYVPGKLVSIVL